MQKEITIINFNRIIDTWIQELEGYAYEQLCTPVSSNSWSMGQLYLHLIEDTQFYINQMKICMDSTAHAEQPISAFAFQLFFNNDFPDERIAGASSNANISQPASKAQLMEGMWYIKNEMNKLSLLINAVEYTGKSRHPGLGYFSAAEWWQFAEIHLRHHLRQKKRIDSFLLSR